MTQAQSGRLLTQPNWPDFHDYKTNIQSQNSLSFPLGHLMKWVVCYLVQTPHALVLSAPVQEAQGDCGCFQTSPYTACNTSLDALSRPAYKTAGDAGAQRPPPWPCRLLPYDRWWCPNIRSAAEATDNTSTGCGGAYRAEAANPISCRKTYLNCLAGSCRYWIAAG